MKIFFSIFFITISIFSSYNKKSAFLKFMYKPSQNSINEVLIQNLEGNELINSKLIEYYLSIDNLKVAEYYSKKNKKITSEFGFIINSKLFLRLKKDEDAIKLLKIALFEYNSEKAFFMLQKLHYREKKTVSDFVKVVEKGVSINPYLISYYYSLLAKNSNKQKQKELFELYLSYNEDLKITQKEFKDINLNKIQQLYYLEKIIIKNKYKWAYKMYKDILFENPYLINVRRLLILK